MDKEAKIAEFRAKIEAKIVELDAKYRRVHLDNVVLLDADSVCDFHGTIVNFVQRFPTGTYEVQCVIWPMPDDLVDDTDDEAQYELDAELMDKLLYQTVLDVGWVIPEDDSLFDEDNVALIFSAGSPDED